MRSDNKPSGFKPDELKLLAARNTDDEPITTFDQLWERIGANYDEGIELVAHTKGVSVERLREVLIEQALREKDQAGSSLLVRNWLVVALVTGLLVLVSLVLRLLGTFAWLPPPLGVSTSIIVAANELAVGDVIRPEDLARARRPLTTDSFTETTVLEGLVVGQAVRRGQPLRFGTLTRLQVAATEDLGAGVIVPTTAITLAWSTYDPTAATQLSQVEGQQTRRPLKKDVLIPLAALEPAPQVDQVVVAVSDGLPAFHRIVAADLTRELKPRVTGSYSTVDELEGRYTLRAVPAGARVLANDVSTGRIEPDALTGRAIVSVPVQRAAVPSSLALPARVTLLFASPSTSEQPALEPLIDDALVLAVTSEGDPAAVTVAVAISDLGTLQQWLGAAEVFIVYAAPP